LVQECQVSLERLSVCWGSGDEADAIPELSDVLFRAW
jgi:hypothetical protein